MSTPVPPAPVSAPTKKSNTLLIVLLVILGIFLLLLASCVGTCLYVGKKAQNYAHESEKSPKIAALALAAAVYPGVEVVSKDLDAGGIVLRNKKTGKTLSLNARDFSEEKIVEILQQIGEGKNAAATSDITSPSESDSSSTLPETASAENDRMLSDDTSASKLRSFSPEFPVYAAGSVDTLEATQQNFGGITTAQHVFVTDDLPGDVLAFYSEKLKAAGYELKTKESTSDGQQKTATSLFQKDGVNNSFNIHLSTDDGKTRVEAIQIVLKQ